MVLWPSHRHTHACSGICMYTCTYPCPRQIQYLMSISLSTTLGILPASFNYNEASHFNLELQRILKSDGRRIITEQPNLLLNVFGHREEQNHVCGLISKSLIQPHWATCQFSCQYQAVFIKNMQQNLTPLNDKELAEIRDTRNCCMERGHLFVPIALLL